MKSYYHYILIGEHDGKGNLEEVNLSLFESNIKEMILRRAPPIRIKISFSNNFIDLLRNKGLKTSNNWVRKRTLVDKIPVSIESDIMTIPPNFKESIKIIDLIFDDSENLSDSD